jgi:hypothetical protein
VSPEAACTDVTVGNEWYISTDDAELRLALRPSVLNDSVNERIMGSDTGLDRVPGVRTLGETRARGRAPV